jgi:hypothetical protein
LVAPAAAVDGPDVASARLYLSGADRLVAAEVHQWHAQRASADALIASVDRDCPRSLSRQAQDGTRAQQATWTAFLGGISEELLLAELRPVHPALARAIHILQRTRFTDRSLNRAISDDVREAGAILSIRPPSLCAQTTVATRSNFTVIPGALSRFVHRAEKAFPDENTPLSINALANRMKPWITAGDEPELTQIHRLTKQLSRDENANLRLWERLIDALAGPYQAVATT